MEEVVFGTVKRFPSPGELLPSQSGKFWGNYKLSRFESAGLR